MEIKKTRIQISKTLWKVLNDNKACGESMEDVILRFVSDGKARMIVRVEENDGKE